MASRESVPLVSWVAFGSVGCCSSASFVRRCPRSIAWRMWRGSFLLAYRSTVSPQRRAVAAWQKKKACSRELHAFRVTPVVPSARTVPDLCFVCDDYACVHTSRHVTLSAGDPLLATTTTNSGSFSETKTSLYSFLSWITRNKLPRCVPKKNKTQREEYSSSGD